MIIVRVELHSAIDGSLTELGRIVICNDGSGSNNSGNYTAQSFRGRDTKTLNRQTISKKAIIKNWPHLRFHVWNLVAKSLKEMGYTEGQ